MFETSSTHRHIVCRHQFGFADAVVFKMSDGAVLFFSVLLGIFAKGLTAVIQTQQTLMAAVGDKVSLHCQLMETKDVLQVTWQKISPRGDSSVATYNELSGQTVNPGFKDKVEFEDAGLQSSSIVINNVTEQDEACYLCLFNSYPEGALTGRTCLQVYELHQPVLHVRESNSTGEVVVSCSATGRPAPTVTLRATRADLNLTDYDSVSVSNTNGTVTVTTTAVLSALHVNSTQVGCRVGVLSGPQIEVLETIPRLKPTSADDFTWIFVLLVVACCCFASVWLIHFIIVHVKEN
ncbi:OX-2 membrane glycoprotein-like [Mugil cephalus]|uniref:OX-2 membrane glycoprotein-like n=1 Tax=Mugil cephalus TaxID=48193 RepID=UPI001FB78D98|nr:OX-2 membrane glycoprotein-like [Mugil cephalus]